MHHRRPRGEHEKTFQERLAEEISHLNDDANGTTRNLPSPQISLETQLQAGLESQSGSAQSSRPSQSSSSAF